MLLALCSFVWTSNARNVIVGGRVVDERQEPLIGVNISVISPDVKAGTATDLDGGFVIEVPQGARIEFSYVGFTAFVYEYR